MSRDTRRQPGAANLAASAPHGKKRSPQHAHHASPQADQPSKRLKTTDSHSSKVNAEPHKTTHRLSLLEKLPTEILEIIFENSFNVSLAQSFGVIGLKLSAPASIKRFCHIVFCEVKDAFRNIYFVGPGVIGEDIKHWRRAREQVLRCRFMNFSFFKDLAGKIEGEEKQRLLKVSSYRNPASEPKFTQFLPVKVYLAYCKIPMDSIRKKGSPEHQVGLIQALYKREVSVDFKSSISGEQLSELWKECVAERHISNALDLVEIMQDGNLAISADMMLWSIQSISRWWTHSFFPFTCDVIGSAVAPICHDDARVTASLKAHNWGCDQSTTLPFREEERREESMTRFLDRHDERGETELQ